MIHCGAALCRKSIGASTLGNSNLVSYIHPSLGQHGQRYVARIGVHDSSH
jgi:hypothetical protein